MPKKPKKWWSVTATYKSVHPEQLTRRRNLWERTTFLIRADGETEAQAVARDVAKGKEHGYTVASGDTVQWTLGEIEDVQELIDEKVQQGMEVRWQFFERIDKPA